MTRLSQANDDTQLIDFRIWLMDGERYNNEYYYFTLENYPYYGTHSCPGDSKVASSNCTQYLVLLPGIQGIHRAANLGFAVDNPDNELYPSSQFLGKLMMEEYPSTARIWRSCGWQDTLEGKIECSPNDDGLAVDVYPTNWWWSLSHRPVYLYNNVDARIDYKRQGDDTWYRREINFFFIDPN